MLTTATVVKDIIKESPLLEDGLVRGIINYSGLAREIRPQIEKKLFKTVQRGAIVMALQRISSGLRHRHRLLKPVRYLADLTVRSKLLEFTFVNSDTIVEKQRKL